MKSLGNLFKSKYLKNGEKKTQEIQKLLLYLKFSNKEFIEKINKIRKS